MTCHREEGPKGGYVACWQPGGCCYVPATFPRESQLHVGTPHIRFEFEGTVAEFAEWCARYARGQA